MVTRKTQLRWRRIIRNRRRQVEGISSNTEESFERYFVKRLVRLVEVRRFLIGWIGLLFILSIGIIIQSRALNAKYQSLQGLPGGTYSEGIIGSFTNANPLYASGTVDSSVSKLVFSSLLKYDANNKLVGDLVDNWSLDSTETKYTVHLKPNLTWHDGQTLTAQDVVFTYKLIQNPETKSYLFPSWQNIKIEANDDRTVVFTLPNSLSSFPYSLTNGIVPEHVLAKVPPAQLRSNTFNNVTPVGSGPFKFSKVEVVGTQNDKRQESIAFNAFSQYHAGRPKLDSFAIRTFANEDSLVNAYSDEQINAMVGLETVPEKFANKSDTAEFSVPLTGEVLVFFRTTQDVLKDAAVRKALVLSADKKDIFSHLPYPLASIDEPLLKTDVGYDKSLQQVTGKKDEARKVLNDAGWVLDPTTNIRTKNGIKLSFRLSSQSTSEYTSVTGSLQKAWREIGADVQVELQSAQDSQSNLALHNYDALLYGISVGSDPDVFPYWHSSQADLRSPTRLNFSEYSSTVASQALEGGRTRSDPQLRTIKYKPFLEAWRNDAPALALYQPRFLYIVKTPMYGFSNKSIDSAADRFTDVHNWMIRQGLK